MGIAALLLLRLKLDCRMQAVVMMELKVLGTALIFCTLIPEYLNTSFNSLLFGGGKQRAHLVSSEAGKGEVAEDTLSRDELDRADEVAFVELDSAIDVTIALRKTKAEEDDDVEEDTLFDDNVRDTGVTSVRPGRG